MPIYEWKETYSVGVKEFDEHHKHLFSLINRLYEAMRAGKGKQEVTPILNELVNYTRFHFASEEKQFSLYKYPNLTQHRAEHEALKEKVVELQAKALQGHFDTPIKVATFLNEWLTKHILKEDKEYAPFFQTLRKN